MLLLLQLCSKSRYATRAAIRHYDSRRHLLLLLLRRSSSSSSSNSASLVRRRENKNWIGSNIAGSIFFFSSFPPLSLTSTHTPLSLAFGPFSDLFSPQSARYVNSGASREGWGSASQEKITTSRGCQRAHHATNNNSLTVSQTRSDLQRGASRQCQRLERTTFSSLSSHRGTITFKKKKITPNNKQPRSGGPKQ